MDRTENEQKKKDYRITLLLSYDNPKLISKATSNTPSDAKKGNDNTDQESSVSTEETKDESIGYIDRIARNLSITRNAFITFCILYFCKMPKYAIRQFIFPYYKYYCKEFGKKNADKKKLQNFTLSIPHKLFKDFNDVRTELVKVKKEEEETIPFGESVSIIKRTNSQLINAILTYMMEYDIIREIPNSNMLGESRNMFKTKSEYDKLCRAFRYTLVSYKAPLQNKKYDKIYEEKQLNRLYEDVIKRYRKNGKKAIADTASNKKDLTRVCDLTESERKERERK